MISYVRLLVSISPIALLACASAPSAQPVAPASASPSAAMSDPSASSPGAAESTSQSSAALSTAASKEDDGPIADPQEVNGAITMAPQLSKSTPRSTFPKVTTTDRACWEGIALSGDHKKDYAEIITKCGAPTGLAEYARPVSGSLHHKHDKRDTYALKLAGGMCYRYFGVADNGITDLDILVQKPNGALVADDKTSQPVAIIESDKPWCQDEDAEYHFHIEVDGTGRGGYTFGVWARPKK